MTVVLGVSRTELTVVVAIPEKESVSAAKNKLNIYVILREVGYIELTFYDVVIGKCVSACIREYLIGNRNVTVGLKVNNAIGIASYVLVVCRLVICLYT